VSVGDLMGATKLGQILGKDVELCGVHSIKDAAKFEVEHTTEQ